MRIFIDSANTLVGKAICKEFYGDTGVPSKNRYNRLYGTLKKVPESSENLEQNAKPEELHKVIESWALRKNLKSILSCAVIIYDLHSADQSDLEYVIKNLRTAVFVQPTTFILISSVMVWARNVNSYVTVHQNEVNPLQKEYYTNYDTVEISDEHFSTSNQTEVKAREKRVPFTSEEYPKRLPYAKYSRWKYLETLVMSLRSVENLRTYVIGAGILYGNGEATFHDVFKAAWLSQKTSRIIGAGDNIIPTVHIQDLAHLLRVISNVQPQSQYHIAVDSANSTQFAIIQGIVDEIGEHYDVPSILPEEALLEKNIDVLTLDVLMVATEIMTVETFNWHSEEGLIKNIQTIAQEYRTARNLKAPKIVVTGPPGSGKTYFSSALASKYCIPHIQVQDFMEQFDSNQSFMQQLVNFNPLNNSQKGLIKKNRRRSSGVSMESTGEDKNTNETNLLHLVQEKLQTCNAIKNRGYILDGFPQTYDEAKALFTKTAPISEDNMSGEGGADDSYSDWTSEESEDDTILSQIAPEFVIALNSSHQLCKARLQNLPRALRLDGYNNEAGYNQRRRIFKENNSIEYGSHLLPSFFQEHSIEILNVDVDTNDPDSILSSLCIYLEREGSTFNFFKEGMEELYGKEKQLEEMKNQQKMQDEGCSKIMMRKQAELKQQRQQEESERLKMIREHELSLLEARSLSIRQYLMKYVIPTLSEGLVELAKVEPKDPIDYLADYLIAHSQDATAKETQTS